MALLAANAMRIGGNPLRTFSGVASVAGGQRRENFEHIGAKMNWFAGEHTISGVTDRAGKPSGKRHPLAFMPARKAGGMASRNDCTLALTVGGVNLAAGRNISGSTSVSLTLGNAALQLVVSASGTASISFTATANLVGALFASGTTSIEFTVDPALLGAIAGASGTATLSIDGNGVLTAIGNMSGSTEDSTVITPASVAAAVWQYIIDSGYSAEEVVRLLAAVTAGKSSGGPGSPVFRDLGDTKDRVTGTADADGNRSAATYDPT